MFKMIKAKIYVDSQKKKVVPKYPRYHLCLSLCEFTMNNNANMSPDPKELN